MEKIDIAQLNENFIHLIRDEWAIITTTDSGKVNAMAATWVQVGYLWNKPVVLLYIRHARHTFSTIDNKDTLSVSFFDRSKYQNELVILGRQSGRDIDKLKECKFTTVNLDEDTPVIEQARISLVVKKLYRDSLKPDHFLFDQTIEYSDNDYHDVFVCEILNAYKQ